MPLSQRLAIGLIVLLMFGGAIGHVVNPELYAPMVPAPIPLTLANAVSVVVEAGVGVMLLVPRTRRLGAWAFTALMVAFLPIHIWDVLREEPAVGSTTAAVIRLVVQGGFIATGAWLANRTVAK